jgi:hypothetical protein
MTTPLLRGFSGRGADRFASGLPPGENVFFQDGLVFLRVNGSEL